MVARGTAQPPLTADLVKGSTVTHVLPPITDWGSAQSVADFLDVEGQRFRTGRANGRSDPTATLGLATRITGTAAGVATLPRAMLTSLRGAANLFSPDVITGSLLTHDLRPVTDWGTAESVEDFLSDSKGRAVGFATVYGEIGTAQPATTTPAAGTSTVSGTLRNTRFAEGLASGSSATTGVLRLRTAIEGAAAGQATADTAVLRLKNGLRGTAAGQATASGAPGYSSKLTALAAGVATVTSVLGKRARVSGTGAGASTATGSLTKRRAFVVTPLLERARADFH